MPRLSAHHMSQPSRPRGIRFGTHAGPAAGTPPPEPAVPGKGATRLLAPRQPCLAHRTVPVQARIHCEVTLYQGACPGLVDSGTCWDQHQVRRRSGHTPGMAAVRLSRALAWAEASLPGQRQPGTRSRRETFYARDRFRGSEFPRAVLNDCCLPCWGGESLRCRSSAI